MMGRCGDPAAVVKPPCGVNMLACFAKIACVAATPLLLLSDPQRIKPVHGDRVNQ
jgi:hypothetical protein